MSRFICKHYRPVFWTLVTVYFMLSLVMTLATDSFVWLWVFTALYLAVGIFGIGLAPNRLIRPTIAKRVNDCDPYPMLAEMETMLTYRLPKRTRAVCLIDYAVALQETGDHPRAYDVLRTVDIESLRMPPVGRFVYYNNLAGLCTRLNRVEEADYCYAQQRQLFGTLPKAVQTKMQMHMIGGAANERFRHGDYVETMRILETASHDTNVARVSDAMLYARAAVRVGEKEKACENLRYVVNYGGRLAIVEEAKAMLNALSCEEV